MIYKKAKTPGGITSGISVVFLPAGFSPRTLRKIRTGGETLINNKALPGLRSFE
jgi:hypothetical protein